MSLLHTIKNVIGVPVHPKGRGIIAIAALITAGLFWLSGYAGLVGLVGLVFCVYFFRNPDRRVPQGEGMVLATGDGVVCHITQAPLPKELEPDGTLYHKISIFLNVFNVHVNRVPASGTIAKQVYVAGKFLSADLDKASKDNERTASLMTTTDGDSIGFCQIAGLVARRIICDLTAGAVVKRGERYGIIRFGSRCDLYIPLHYTLMVTQGTTTIGGETIVAVKPDSFRPQSLTWEKI